MTQEFLHHRLLKNQQKMKPESVSKKSKNRHKEDHRFSSSIKGSPLLNKYEMDKRQTFNEIVNGFPFANKQKKLIESIYNTDKQNIITDDDVVKYQQAQLVKFREKTTIPGKREINLRSLVDAQLQNLSNKDMNVNTSIDVDNIQNESLNKENRKSVYISSRISRWIESMIGENKVDESTSASKIKLHNSVNKFRESIEESPQAIAYRHTFVSQTRPSFIEGSDFKTRKSTGFAPISIQLRKWQATPATDNLTKNFNTSSSYN